MQENVRCRVTNRLQSGDVLPGWGLEICNNLELYPNHGASLDFRHVI